MQQSTEVWILSAAVMVLGAIISFAAKLITQQVIKRLDSIIGELQHLTRTTITQESDIKKNAEGIAVNSHRLDKHDDELDNHSVRLSRVEERINIK